MDTTDAKAITAASANDDNLALVIGGQVLASFDLQSNAQLITQKDLGADHQISGVTVLSSQQGSVLPDSLSQQRCRF